MAALTISYLAVLVLITTLDLAYGKAGHVRHRIHVPTKVKTVYHTKIIKVPEHHHYFHEKKEKHLINIPEHHHHHYDEHNRRDKKQSSWKNKPALDLPFDLHDYHESKEQYEDDSSEHDPDTYSSYSNSYNREYNSYGEKRQKVTKKPPPVHRYNRKFKRSRG